MLPWDTIPKKELFKTKKGNLRSFIHSVNLYTEIVTKDDIPSKGQRNAFLATYLFTNYGSMGILNTYVKLRFQNCSFHIIKIGEKNLNSYLKSDSEINATMTSKLYYLTNNVL